MRNIIVHAVEKQNCNMFLQLEALQFYVGSSLSRPNETDVSIDDFYDNVRFLQRKVLTVMPGFHHSVAVSPLPLRKFRKNSVSAVRITLHT